MPAKKIVCLGGGSLYFRRAIPDLLKNCFLNFSPKDNLSCSFSKFKYKFLVFTEGSGEAALIHESPSKIGIVKKVIYQATR